MRPRETIYPALSRFYDTTDSLASTCCMSRKKLLKKLRGDIPFTTGEQRAICTDIMARMYAREIREEQEINMNSLYGAYNGQFEKLFRKDISA